MLKRMAILAIFLAAAAGPARGQDAPASQPAAISVQLQLMDPHAVVRRLRTRLLQMDLSRDQRAELSTLFDSAEVSANAVHQQADSLPPDARMEKFIEFQRDLRQDIADLLTPEQLNTVRQLIGGRLQQLPPAARDAPTRDALAPTAAAPPTRIPAEKDYAGEGPGKGARVGDDASFTAISTAGNGVKSSDFKGRVLIVEFGSYSSPAFRDRVRGMQEIYSKYSGRASFLVIFTREEKPAGKPDSQRNDEDGVKVDQPADLSARLRRANDARQALGISIPCAVDMMDAPASDALSGFPNATVIIGRDGRISARQQWTDPSGLPRLIEAALAVNPRG